jgi:hypothetical protein
MKAQKIKVTKQQIRVYTAQNDIRTFSYDEEFLKKLTAPEGSFKVSESNKNATWYERTTKAPAIEETPKIEATVEQIATADYLEAIGYEITDSARREIESSDLTAPEILEDLEGEKITAWHVKKLKK